MNKLGFQIVRFFGGPVTVMTLNGGDWAKKVVDIRNILTLYSEDSTKFAMFMSFSETGTYLCVARVISGRGGDNTAGWIYIPNTVEISGKELIDIIGAVKEEISAPKSDAERLKSIFDKVYPALEPADFSPSSAEKVYAKREVGFYPLQEIIGINRYQPEYAKFNAILIEDNDSMKVVDKNVVDLSSVKMIDTFVFCPPVKSDIPAGVTVHLGIPGEPAFIKPVRVLASTPLNIIFKRKGSENIIYMETVEENNQICGVPKVFDWKCIVSRAAFKVVSAHKHEKDLTADAKICVNGIELTLNKPVKMSEQEAANVEVTVSRKGYETKRVKKNLLNTTGPVTIELTRAEESQEWIIELANGHHAEMTLKSKYLPSKSSTSPLKGYSVGERSNQLDYTNFGVLKERIIGFLIALGVFAVVYLCVALWGYFDSHNFEWQAAWPPLKVTEIVDQGNPYPQSGNSNKPKEPVNQTPKTATEPVQKNDPVKEEELSLQRAIDYLDNNAVWTKAKLDEFKELQGLYDDLNNFNIPNLKKRNNVLGKSAKFTEIIEAANTLPAGTTFDGKYNKNDKNTDITLVSYIKTIKNKVSVPSSQNDKKTSPSTPTPKPEALKPTDTPKNVPGSRGGV